ncbi:MAG TPA: PrsW family intramembrane metalloprotease [Pseudolabrys sp.]
MTNLPPAPPPLGVPAMPPTPRDLAGPSDSEIIPFSSTKINILKSGILIPLGVTAAVCMLLFSMQNLHNNFSQYASVLTAYLLFCIFYAAYIYSGIQKPIFIYIIPMGIVYLELNTSFFSFLAFVFRDILPGGDPTHPAFLNIFISYFFGAGLLEELTKAVPALIGLFLVLRTPSTAANAPASRYLDWFRVSTPLEGIMFGLAAGAGFIIVETLGQYVPKHVGDITKVAGEGFGLAEGFALMVPRVLQGVIGHMAWAGIFGYFIGLVARYPGSMIKLLTIGWLVAAVLHTLWDAAAVSNSVTGLWVDGAITLFVFVGCFLKAKQLEAVRKGPAFIPTDSIIVGGVPLPVATGTLPEHNATAWGGLSQVVGAFFRPKATTATPGAYPMGAPAVPQPSMAAPQAAPVPRFILSNGAERYGIVAGQTIDLAMLFPERGLSSGTLAEVTVHPQDAKAIGLKNMTSVVWAVTLDTGATTTVAAGRSVKLVANEKIKIGAVTIDVQAV